MRLRIRDRHMGYVFVLPALLMLVVVLSFPAVVSFIYSVTPEWSREGGFTAANYVNLVRDPLFWTSLRNTLLFVGSSVALHFVLGLALAVALNSEIRGRLVFRLIALLPWTVPDVIAGIIFRWMCNPLHGIINDTLYRLGLITEPIRWLSSPNLAMPSVVFANVWRGFPFVMLILLAGLQAIPRDLYEAAAIDGTSRIQSFLYITLPSLRKMIVVALALDVIWETRRFGLVQVMTAGGPGDKTEILSTLVYKQYFSFFRFEYASAVAVVMTVILLAASLPYIRLILKTE